MNAETVLGNLFTALDLAHRQRVEVVPRWLVERVLEDDFLVEEVADIAGFEKSKVRKLLEKALYRALAGPEKLSGLSLPFSWRVIATMNLVDRAHLFRLGFALLRRFPLVLVPGVGGKVWPKLRTERIEKIEQAMPHQRKLLYKNLQALIRDEICRSSINQLFVRSNITEYDRPVYILGMGDNVVHETLNMFENVVKIIAILIAEMSSIGVEIGPALLADICRVLLIARLYTSASDNLVDLVADIAVASLLLPQLGAIAPAIKSELLFGGEVQRARRVRDILELARNLLGEDSMSARYAEALSLEIPVQGV